MVDNDLSFRSFADLQGLSALKSPANQDDPKALETVARQFESLFLNMLLKNMRQANEAFSEGSYFESNQTRFYRDMLDQQLSLSLSSGKGLGISEVLVRQLSPKGAEQPVSAATTDGSVPQRQLFDRTLEQTARAAVEALARKQQDVVGSASSDDGEQAALPELRPGDFVDAIKEAEARVRREVEAIKQEAPVDPAATDDAVAVVGTAGNEPRVVMAVPVEPALPDRFESPADFVSAIYPLARRVAGEFGLDPGVLVAQSALETGWGRHLPHNADGSNSFNLFGIKADRRWDGQSAVVNTLEFRDGVAAREKAAFRSYGSYQESLQDYVDFIRENPRYQQAVAQVGDNDAYLQQLQLAGYATDPEYARKISGILTGEVLQTALATIKEI